MINIWSQTVTEGAVTGANALNQSILHQKVEVTVNGNSVYPLGSVQSFNNFLGTQRVGTVSDDFQDTESIGSMAQTTIFKETKVVTLIAHNILLLATIVEREIRVPNGRYFVTWA
jgi:hypothetical protein